MQTNNKKKKTTKNTDTHTTLLPHSEVSEMFHSVWDGSSSVSFRLNPNKSKQQAIHAIAEAARYLREPWVAPCPPALPGGSQGVFRPSGMCFFPQHVLDLPLGLLQIGLAWIIPTGRHPNQMPEPPQLALLTLSSFHPAKEANFSNTPLHISACQFPAPSQNNVNMLPWDSNSHQI